MFIEKGNLIQDVCILVFNLFTRNLHRVPLNNKDNVVTKYWSSYLLVGSVYSPDYRCLLHGCGWKYYEQSNSF